MPSKKHKPGWRFTVATYDVEPTLIFHRPECKEANPDEVLQEILKHPVLGPAAAFGLVIDRDEATTERFEVHFDAAHCLLPEVALNPNEYVYYVSVDGKPLEKLDLYEVYYSCTLPHKINTGCEDCMQEQTVRSCRHKQFIKKCHSNYVQEMTLGHTVTAEHFTDALKNRKDVVADCLYISPTLTAPQHFMKKLRPPADHDFDMEEEHSDNRKKAARERKRKKQFIAEVCSECLVHTACHGDSPFYDYSSVEPHDITYCRGHYAMSEEEAVEEILANYTIPYDDEFLQRVLYFAAGELPKRINNKKAHLTCFVSPGRKRLAVGVMYTVQGYHEELIRGDLEDLVTDVIETKKSSKRGLRHYPYYSKQREFDAYKLPPLTNLQKALLIELATRSYSPTQNSHWHQTRYPVLFIDAEDYWTRGVPGWTVHFRYNKYLSDRGWETAFQLTAANFADVYRNYRNLRTLCKTQSPLNHLTY